MRSRFGAAAAKKSRRAQLIARAPRISPTIEAAHVRDVTRVVRAYHALLKRAVQPQLRQDIDWRSLKDKARELSEAFRSTALETARRMEKFSKAEAVRTIGDLASDLPERVVSFAVNFAADAVIKVNGLLEESLSAAEDLATTAEVVGEEVGTFSLEGMLDSWLSRAAQSARNMVTQGTAELNQERHESLGITDYVWFSMHDDKVRAEHRALDMQECSYDDPPLTADKSSSGEACNPGDDYECRCLAAPIVTPAEAEVAAAEDEDAA